MHCRRRPLDVCKPTQAQQGQDGIAMGRIHSLSQQGRYLPVLHLGSDTITPCDHVRLLGVKLSSDLSLDRHVSIVSASCFYWLRQLRRSRRSLDAESAATLVHAFVASIAYRLQHGLLSTVDYASVTSVFKYTLQTPTTRRDASYKSNVVLEARSGG